MTNSDPVLDPRFPVMIVGGLFFTLFASISIYNYHEDNEGTSWALGFAAVAVGTLAFAVTEFLTRNQPDNSGGGS